MRVRHGDLTFSIIGLPLPRDARLLAKLPIIAKEVLEVAVVPLHRIAGPRTLEAAGDRVRAFAGFESVSPAEPLLFEITRFGFTTAVFSRAGSTMSFAKSVAARNQRYGLF